MTAMLGVADLTASDRRRVVCELAELYTAEQPRADRPLTDVLPELLDGIRAHHIASDVAVDLFDRFSRHRAAGDDRSAERLLDQLVGEDQR